MNNMRRPWRELQQKAQDRKVWPELGEGFAGI